MFDDYTWYFKNDITNLFKVRIPYYDEHFCHIFDLVIFLSSDRKNGIEFDNANHTRRKIFFEGDTINKAIKYGLPLTI